MAKGRGPLAIAIERWLAVGGIRGILGDWLIRLAESVEGETAKELRPIIQQVIIDNDLPAEFNEALRNVLSGDRQGGAASIVGFGLGLGQSAAASFAAPAFKKLNYKLDRVVRSARIDPAIAMAMLYRNPGLRDTITGHLLDLGWQDVMISTFEELFRPLPPEQALISLGFRFPERRAGVESELIRRGYLPEEIEDLFTVSEFIPGPQDLIRFAVREVFNPDVVERFGLDDDFPPEFADLSARVGMPPETARQFWAAHWQLPGATLGFEMFHRLRSDRTDFPFTQEDLNDLLRALDFSPFWRDRLREIAFTPVARVDIRRLLRTGIWSEDRVLDANLDRGYKPEDAIALTEFAIQEAFEREFDITRSAIERQYKRRIIDRETAVFLMDGIGIRETSASFFLDIVDLQVEEEMIAEELDRLEFLFIEGEIEEVEVYNELGRFDMPAAQINRRIEIWTIRRRKKVSLPTESELTDYYFRGIIELDELATQLRKRRWSDQRIMWKLEELDQQVVELRQKETERAQKEAERVQQSDLTAAYQQAITTLDVDLALLRFEEATLKDARHAIEDEDDLNAIADRIREIKVDTAAVKLAKAEVRQARFSA